MEPIKPGEVVTYDIDRLREFIARCEWRWARTMVDIPHEYIYRGRCALTDDEYYYFLKAQVYCGEKEWYGRKLNSYLYIDGYKYWTMGDYIPENNTMNRQKVFNEFDLLPDPCPQYYSDEDLVLIANVLRQFDTNIFDAGCGDGRVFKHIGIAPKQYYGVDPSKKAVARFRESNEGMYQRICTRPFEEVSDKWMKTECVVVALFGSASYLMTQYLQMVAKANKPHFLMFFREGFIPAVLESTHTFQRKEEDLRRLFPYSHIHKFGDYLVVTNQEVNWEKAKSPVITNPSLFD